MSEARERLRVDALSDKDRQAYYRHMESVRHMKSLFDTSRDEGYEEGMDKGLAKGMDKGLAKGLAKGRSERAKEIAKQLKAMGLTTEQIAQATGLTLDEI